MLNATTTAGAQLRNLVIIVICIALLAGINVVSMTTLFVSSAPFLSL